jgi:hypothetical protein
VAPFGWESCHSTAIEHGHDGIQHIFIIGAWMMNLCVGEGGSMPTISGGLGSCPMWKLLGQVICFHRYSMGESVGDWVAARFQHWSGRLLLWE